MAARLRLGRVPRRAAAAVLVTSLAVGLAACATEGPAVTFPPESFGPGPVTGAADATEAAVVAALAARSVQSRSAQVPFRSPESASLASAPRRVVQAILPDNSDHGFISIYEFRDVAAAEAAGREMAAYVASGPGRVQFVPDEQFVLRRLGTTLIFYSWSPGTVTDPQAPDVPAALETVGDGIEIRAR